jgi:predicted LPLAT superfamily acyltransferase
MTQPRKPSQWVAHGERGSWLLLRAMAFVSVHCGRTLSRGIVYAIAVYFFLFGPTARRSARRYLRLALGREPKAIDRFRLILSFATTIHDRVYLIGNRFHLFNITVDGEELLGPGANGGSGVLLLGAHLGSFEVIHSMARRHGFRVAMAMYEENARKISTILAAINPQLETDIVALGHIDAMLKISDRLNHGVCVGVLGDRTLGEEDVQKVSLLGEPAFLPSGPLRAAAILRCPVIFMAGLYLGANNYHVVFERIADFTSLGTGERSAAVQAAIARYAAVLDKYCRSHPYNWFNFFEFWRARA